MRKFINNITLIKEEQLLILQTGSTTPILRKLSNLQKLLYSPIRTDEVKSLITITKKEFTSYLIEGAIQYFYRDQIGVFQDGTYYTTINGKYQVFYCERGIVSQKDELLDFKDLVKLFTDVLWF